jgi:hypothetical protein
MVVLAVPQAQCATDIHQRRTRSTSTPNDTSGLSIVPF